MKFKFSLNPVLKVRQHQENIQKQKLAEEVQKVQEINNLMDEMQMKLEDYLTTSGEKATVTVLEMKRHITHLETVHKNMVQLDEALESASDKVQEERGKLAEAHIKVHMMQKMRDTEESIFVEKVSKGEQKFMDEIATQSFAR